MDYIILEYCDVINYWSGWFPDAKSDCAPVVSNSRGSVAALMRLYCGLRGKGTEIFLSALLYSSFCKHSVDLAIAWIMSGLRRLVRSRRNNSATGHLREGVSSLTNLSMISIPSLGEHMNPMPSPAASPDIHPSHDGIGLRKVRRSSVSLSRSELLSAFR